MAPGRRPHTGGGYCYNARLATTKGGDPVRDSKGKSDLHGSDSGFTRSVRSFGRQ
jgi:hypothetical protein